MAALWRWYSAKLYQHPLPTKMVTSSMILGSGDATAQFILGESDWNYRRTGIIALYGGCILAPWIHTWFNFLSRTIRLETRKHKLPWLALMITADQVVGASVALSMFMCVRGFADGHSIPYIKSRFKRHWFDTWVTGLHVWGPTQAINFWLVPLPFRVLVNNCVSFGWNTYLAIATSREHKKAEAEAQQK